MPLPATVTSPAVGDPGQASWADNVAAWINFLANPPLFRGYQTAVQSIPNATWTGLSLDTTVYDTYTWHNVNTRYTPALPGYYEVKVRCLFAANATGIRAVGVAINGATPATVDGAFQIPGTGTTQAEVEVTATVFCNGTSDYIAFGAWQNSGAALNTAISGVAGASSGEVRWVHA